MDEGRLLCAVYTKGDLQNTYYEGYTTSVEVTNLFVVDCHEAIIHASINFPGSWHDAKLAIWSSLKYLELSDTMTTPRYATLCTSAFKVDVKEILGEIVRAQKTIETVDVPENFELYATDLVLQKVYSRKT